MTAGDIYLTVATAVGAALFRDLKEFQAPDTDRTRRLTESEVEVFVFPEGWPSTALGYGGVGGQAFTTAYTVIVASFATDEALVYWGPGGRLGRRVSYEEGRIMASRLHSRANRG